MSYIPYYQYQPNRAIALPQVDNTIGNQNNPAVFSRLGPWSNGGGVANDNQAQARPAESPFSSAWSLPPLTFAAAPAPSPTTTSSVDPNVAAAAERTSSTTTATATPPSIASTSSSTTSSAVTGPSQASGFVGTQVHAADASTSSGLAKGTLFAAIFIPIVAIAFICSLCLICFMRRRRRMRKELATRSMNGFPQPSVEQLSSNPFSARQSRATPSLPPMSPFTRYSAMSEPETSGPRPLITVDGPSYSRSPEEATSPPAYKPGSPPATSPTTANPPRPHSGQLSEANMAMHRNQSRSPFDDPDDDAVSDISDGADPYGVRRDVDNLSIVSSTTGYPARRPTNARRL